MLNEPGKPEGHVVFVPDEVMIERNAGFYTWDRGDFHDADNARQAHHEPGQLWLRNSDDEIEKYKTQ